MSQGDAGLRRKKVVNSRTSAIIPISIVNSLMIISYQKILSKIIIPHHWRRRLWIFAGYDSLLRCCHEAAHQWAELRLPVTNSVTGEDVARALPLASVDELERHRRTALEQRRAFACDHRKEREV